MGLEAATYIEDLVGTNPTGADDKNQGDNHLRLIKDVLQSQFPNLGAAAVAATAAELNKLDGCTASTAELNKLTGCTASTAELNLNDGLTATAAQLNDLINNNRGTPSGAILMWHGNVGNIPTGWVLCDGANSTPNLTSKFILASTTANITGGSNAHSHDASQPAHTHAVSAVGWGVAGGPLGTVAAGQLVVGSGTVEVSEALESLRASGNNVSTGGSAPAITVNAASNIPEFYSLIFIMKV